MSEYQVPAAVNKSEFKRVIRRLNKVLLAYYEAASLVRVNTEVRAEVTPYLKPYVERLKYRIQRIQALIGNIDFVAPQEEKSREEVDRIAIDLNLQHARVYELQRERRKRYAKQKAEILKRRASNK